MKIFKKSQNKLYRLDLVNSLKELPNGCYLTIYKGEATIMSIRSAIRDLRRDFSMDFHYQKVERNGKQGIVVTKLNSPYYYSSKKKHDESRCEDDCRGIG